MDKETERSIFVALLPQDDYWCKIQQAHMTLIYAGETDNVKASRFNELAKDVMSISMLSEPVVAKVMGVAVFGDFERVDVLRLAPTPEILAMRKMLEDWDVSEFPFTPHATIGPEGSSNSWDTQANWVMPMYLRFDRILVGWGTENLIFWLRKY